MTNWIRCFFTLLIIFHGHAFPHTNVELISKPQKTVFITGAAGFIGSNFLQYMFDKYPQYHFIVLDALTYAGSLDNIPSYIRESTRFKFVHGSVVDFPLVDELMSKSDLVVHFAAKTHVTKSIYEDYDFYNTDVMGTRSMMAALVKHAKTVERFIHISTSEVYGTAEMIPMSESHPLKPRSPYAAAKTGADRLVFAYSCTYDIPVVIIRPFNNYGPKQHLEKMLPFFITSAIERDPIIIHGEGKQKRDWIHTLDVSLALDKVLHIPDFDKIKNQEINIGSGKAISVLEIAKTILKHFNLPENQYLKFVEDRPGQVECHIADISKAQKLLGWTPSIDIEEGMKTTIDWYVNHPSFWIRIKSELASKKAN